VLFQFVGVVVRHQGRVVKQPISRCILSVAGELAPLSASW
jgi:hypothetical protein